MISRKKILYFMVPMLAFMAIVDQARAAFGIDDVIEIIHLGKAITSGVVEVWDLVEQTSGGKEMDLPFRNKKQKKILSRVTDLARKIDNVELTVLSAANWNINSISSFVSDNTKLVLNLHELDELMHSISSQDRLMRSFALNSATLEQETLLEFAQITVSSNRMAIQGMLDRLHFLVTGSKDLENLGNTGTFRMIADSIEEAQTEVCSTRQSAQQVLFQLYNAVSITELKGYAMMQFSWMLLKTYGKGNFTAEAQIMRDHFNERTLKTQEVIRKVMERADRSVWRCDPSHYVEGETYEAVTRLLQGYVENEVDMNNDNTCRENCGAYQFTESYGCYKDLYCARQPKCSGKILNCQFFDSDMWICPSKSTSLRRYEFIEYENGRVLGKMGGCSQGTTKVDSWWRWLFWHCSYCLCVCDEQGPRSDRYFNLRESVSNITANRVVTGLRLQKVNRIFHLQIQEGELLPRGQINASSVEWRPISDYKLLDRGIRNGQDYHTLSWDKRAIDLDDLIAPASHVVTGVRFRTVGTHLNFEIRVTELNFASGKLIDPETTSIWMSNDNTDSSVDRRTPVKLIKPDVPTLSISPSAQDSKTNQYIEFTHSDIERDVGQTTVPFVDTQDVISMPPVALSGAGIYHKGQPGYGGFIAAKLITYDFGPHIQTPSPENSEEIKIIPLQR